MWPFDLLPSRRTAAVEALGQGGIVGAVDGAIASNPLQQRARDHAASIPWVQRPYRFLAWQGARATRFVEVVDDDTESGWRRVEADPDDKVAEFVYYALRAIRSRTRSQDELVRQAVYLNETIGEFLIIPDVEQDNGAAAWAIYDPEAVQRSKQGPWTVMRLPGGKVRNGTARQVPREFCHRVWTPDDVWELRNYSSLMALTSDLDTYALIVRQMRRRFRSRLGMNDVLWTPSEAHREKVKGRDGQPTGVSKLSRSFAEMAARSVNDLDDRQVASVAPFLLDTPGSMKVPQLISMGALDPQLLLELIDLRNQIAMALPLSKAKVLDQNETTNHWNAWLADEDDLEVVEDALRVPLDGLTAGPFRDLLRAGSVAGEWSGNPDLYRIAADTSNLAKRPDNSTNAMWAFEQSPPLISAVAARRELHFDEEDAPDDTEVATALEVAGARERAFQPDERGLPPGGPVPEQPPAQMAAAQYRPTIDDRYLLAQQ